MYSISKNLKFMPIVCVVTSVHRDFLALATNISRCQIVSIDLPRRMVKRVIFTVTAAHLVSGDVWWLDVRIVIGTFLTKRFTTTIHE